MAEVCTGDWAEAPEGADWCVEFPNTIEFWAQGFVECFVLLLVILLIERGWNRFKRARRKVYVVPPTTSPYDESSPIHRERGRR